MYRGFGRPPSEPLSINVERNRTETPQGSQAHVQHDWLDIPALLNPRGDELAEAVPPQVLIDRDGNEDRACDGLVAVHGVGAGNGWQGSNLDSSRGIPDDHNDLPVPFILIPKCDHKVSDDHDDHVNRDSRQSHFRFANTSILASGPHGDPIGEGSVGGQSDEGTDQNGKVEETDRLTVEVVWRFSKGLALREVQRQETTGRPGHNKGRKLDDGEGQELPGVPEAKQDGLDVVSV